MTNDEGGEIKDNKSGAFMGDASQNRDEKVYDLEERTARFGETVIFFAKKIPCNPVTVHLITQFVDAGTSIGANYCEADDAVSKKDFRHKISISKKEARETKYWLRMLSAAKPSLKTEARILWKEAHELHLILSAIWRRCKIEKTTQKT